VKRRVIQAGLLASVVISGVAAQATQAAGTIQLVQELRHDVSPPLRVLAAANMADGKAANDAAAQGLTVTQNAATLGLNFAGINGTGVYHESDSNGSVGATQYVQWVNANFAVYSKTTGQVLMKSTSAETLWAGFGGLCQTTNAGDGIILYDKAAGQWLISHHSGGSAGILQCVAISTTSDATGSYYRYAFPLTTQFPDWPKIGIWPDAYYVSMNLEDFGSYHSIGAEVCALDRTNMLRGNTTNPAQCFTTGTPTLDYVLMPSDLDGATPPPVGSPNYLLSLDVDGLDLYQFHVDWATPANSTLSGPTFIPVMPFKQLCVNGGACISQPGTTDLLDSLGDRVMFRLAYRNFGTYESLVANHTVTKGSGSGIRWYEIRSPRTSPVVYQQETFAPDSNYRFVGSVAMDHLGDMMGGYVISSSTVFPGIRFSGRLVTDPLSTWETEQIIAAGGGSLPANDHSLTDLSSISIDPVDDCTFWYTAAYAKTSGVDWSTWIASLKWPGCS